MDGKRDRNFVDLIVTTGKDGRPGGVDGHTSRGRSKVGIQFTVVDPCNDTTINLEHVVLKLGDCPMCCGVDGVPRVAGGGGGEEGERGVAEFGCELHSPL